MTTVTAAVQGGSPPRIVVTVEDAIIPTVDLLTNGSFETPDLGGASTDFNPVPWYEFVTAKAPTTTRAPFVLRQGPSSLSGQTPADGARFFLAAYTADAAKRRIVAMAQDVAVSPGVRVKADAKMQASNANTADSSIYLQVVPTKAGVDGGSPGLGQNTAPTYGAWQSLHAEATIPEGYDGVSIRAVFDGAPVTSGSVSLIDAVTATAGEPNLSSLSLVREVDEIRSPVRGAQGIPNDPDMVVIDNEAPFGKPIRYIYIKTYADGSTVETVSNVVELTTDLPWISHPITGVGVQATITEWTDLTYAARQTIVAVAGRARPIAISDVRLAPSSDLTLLTKTRDALTELRGLLALGDVLLIRPACDAVEGDYLAIGDVTETRVNPTGDGAGSDWRRLIKLEAQAVDIPDTAIPAIGDTLADLAAYVPTTLADLATAFGANATLLTIAQTDVSPE